MRLDEDGNAFKVDFVSIHASVKDATRSSAGGLTMPCFNPRICKRCDHRHQWQVQYNHVSIHASVKDATLYGLSDRTVMGFNPRICKRCDQIIQW